LTTQEPIHLNLLLRTFECIHKLLGLNLLVRIQPFVGVACLGPIVIALLHIYSCALCLSKDDRYRNSNWYRSLKW
jgi:hypothetical protein